MNLHGSCVPSWSDSESVSFDVGCVGTLLDSFYVFDVYSTILHAKMSSNIASQLKRKLQKPVDYTNGTISTTSGTSTITGTSYAVHMAHHRPRRLPLLLEQPTTSGVY